MSAAKTGYLQNYKRTEIETATPSKLLLMLYDGAIQRLESAEEHQQLGKWEAAHKDLVRVQDILTELMVSLDWEMAGSPAPQLFSLYNYMHQALVKANVERESEPIHEVNRMLSELRNAWQEAISSVESGTLPQQAPQRRSVDLQG